MTKKTKQKQNGLNSPSQLDYTLKLPKELTANELMPGSPKDSNLIDKRVYLGVGHFYSCPRDSNAQ